MSVFSLIEQTSVTDPHTIEGDAILKTAVTIAGMPMEFCIGIHQPEATLADIVPLARAISDAVCSAVQDDLTRQNQPVSCRKGCSSCCYYLVPMSLPEVYYLHHTLKNCPPEVRDQVVQMTLGSACKILSEKGLLEPDSGRENISQWYAGLNLPCPFLVDDACGIYEQRPIACREYMSTEPASFCNPQHAEDPGVVTLPVSILEALGLLAAQLEETDVEAVMMPLAFHVSKDVIERSNRKWPAKMMIEKFINILAGQSKEAPAETVTAVVG